jgi:hypothetical protein
MMFLNLELNCMAQEVPHLGILNPHRRHCVLVREDYTGFIQCRTDNVS